MMMTIFRRIVAAGVLLSVMSLSGGGIAAADNGPRDPHAPYHDPQLGGDNTIVYNYVEDVPPNLMEYVYPDDALPVMPPKTRAGKWMNAYGPNIPNPYRGKYLANDNKMRGKTGIPSVTRSMDPEAMQLLISTMMTQIMQALPAWGLTYQREYGKYDYSNGLAPIDKPNRCSSSPKCVLTRGQYKYEWRASARYSAVLSQTRLKEAVARLMGYGYYLNAYPHASGPTNKVGTIMPDSFYITLVPFPHTPVFFAIWWDYLPNDDEHVIAHLSLVSWRVRSDVSGKDAPNLIPERIVR